MAQAEFRDGVLEVSFAASEPKERRHGEWNPERRLPQGQGCGKIEVLRLSRRGIRGF